MKRVRVRASVPPATITPGKARELLARVLAKHAEVLRRLAG